MSGLFDQVVNYSPPLLTAGQVNYDGTWNAATNTPTLVNPPDALSKGDYYVVSAAGTQFSISFAVGDWIISNGTAWEKVDLTDAVSSVFGRTGAVVGDSTDYSAVGLTNTAIGAANPSTGAFTSLSSSSTTTLNGTTIPASKTLVVTTDKLSALAATTSAELAGVISDETGSGSLVFANSPTLVTPALGTPSALVGTNITGTAAAFNINGTVGATTPSTVAATSVAALSDSGYQAVVGQLTTGDRVGISGQASGSGAALVFFDNAQTTFRPAIFDASSHSLKISGVEKASVTSTGLQGAIGATTASTGAFTTVTASSTIAATGAVTGSNLSGTNTGDQTITLTGGVTGSGTGSFAATVVTNANLTGAITSSGNATLLGSFSSANLASALTDETGSGAAVFATSPTLVTPILGTPTSGTVTNLTGTASININGTVGATTPSTGAFTTLSATGAASVTGAVSSANAFVSTGAVTANGANRVILDFGEGTTGRVLAWGANNSTAGQLSLGVLSANATVGNTSIGLITSTGLAVTGALSSTTGANFATSSGSVGIGTASPSGKLTIVASTGGLNNTGVVIDGLGAPVLQLGSRNGEAVIGSNNFGSTPITFKTGMTIGDFSTGTERMRIDSSGNVGIGTSLPSARLSVSGVTPQLTNGNGQLSVFSTDAIGADKGGKISFGGVSGATGFDPYGFCAIAGLKDNATASNFSGYLTFSTSTSGGTVTERMRIDSSGNVGIGTSSPGSKLDVNGELRIGNTVNTVSPTSPNRTVTIVIGGTTYYLHAKTTND